MPINPQIPLLSRAPDVSGGINILNQSIQRRQDRDIADREFRSNQEVRDLQKQKFQSDIDALKETAAGKQAAADMLDMQLLANTKQYDELGVFLDSRKQKILGRGGDTLQTDQLIEVLRNDPSLAREMINQGVVNYTRRGLIEPDARAKGKLANHVNAPVPLVKKDEEGNVIERRLAFPVINKNTLDATLELADIPAGFELSLETPEEKRQAELITNLEEIKKELKIRGEVEPTIKAQEKLAADAAKKAESLFNQVDKTTVAIGNLKAAREAVASGAGTGPLEQFWPSFREQSVILDNVQGRAALDIIGATTFGALSKGELDLSKVIAIPTGLEGPAMLTWLDDRIAAEEAKIDYLQRQAIFLSSTGPGGKQNTRADWENSEKAAMQTALDAFNVTEDDIKETMRVNDMDRSQVLREIRRRHESGGT